ncbi:energy transducer TonB [Qipengyuania sp. GH1]|uniref:energy transducer TonB n=1 Tax=Qipengyuania aestuarii TaxID=2867241 RepID=UPI001C873904|nr:energy transducer TonB [Qipengyuania aestuarii]MBX7536507.1 energy transducer TonB [Qipengyuania aestuarii]
MRISRFLFAITSLGLAGSAIQPAFAAEDEAQVLKPVGPWQLDMGENKCRIARVFGEDDQQTLFYLEQWDPSVAAHWTIAGPPVEKYKSWRDTRATFGPGGDEGEFQFQESTLGDWGNAISGFTTVAASDRPEEEAEGEERDYAAHPRGLPALDAEGGAKIETVSLSQRNRSTVVLELGGMQGVLEAMNNCMANLVEHWGFNLEEQKTVQSPPQPKNLSAVVKRIVDYYPSGALWKGAQADFHLRLTVRKDGTVKSCTLLNQTVAEDFDMRRHPCAAFQQIADFEPALTAQGVAVESYYTTRIRYSMPS